MCPAMSQTTDQTQAFTELQVCLHGYRELLIDISCKVIHESNHECGALLMILALL